VIIIVGGAIDPATPSTVMPASDRPHHPARWPVWIWWSSPQFVGMPRKMRFQGELSIFVAKFGGGAMSVDIIDLVRLDARVLQGIAHHPERAINRPQRGW